MISRLWQLSAICIAKDQVCHERTKHIDVRYHFLRGEKGIKVVKVGIVDIRYVYQVGSAWKVPNFFELAKHSRLMMALRGILMQGENLVTSSNYFCIWYICYMWGNSSQVWDLLKYGKVPSTGVSLTSQRVEVQLQCVAPSKFSSVIV